MEPIPQKPRRGRPPLDPPRNRRMGIMLFGNELELIHQAAELSSTAPAVFARMAVIKAARSVLKTAKGE